MGTALMDKKDLTYAGLFVCVVIAYCIFLAPNGYEEWDTGFISGLAWRMVNGESIYADFIYTKPPVTPTLAALYLKILPQTGQFYFIRCINYTLFAIQTLLTVFAVNAVYPLKKAGINPWGLAIVGFAVSYLNISPYPWYTEDGLLFAAAALFAKTYPKKSGAGQLFLVALLALLSALSKQSFYPVPILFAIWILLENGRKPALIYAAWTVVLVGLFLYIIARITTLSNFFSMISGQTHLADLFMSGCYGYFEKNFLIYCIIAFIVVALSFIKRKDAPFIKVTTRIIYLQFIAGIVLLFAGEAPRGSMIVFTACACAVLYNFFHLKKTINQLLLPAMLMAIGWCASISWGYPYPVFCSTGLILAFLLLMQWDIPVIRKQYLTLVGFAVFAAGLAYNWTPYRQAPLPEVTSDMGTISPKLKYIKADKPTFDRFMELKGLVAKYGPNYIVTTNYPGAHYLFNTHNPLPADWMINSEYSFRLREMVAIASKSGAYIFLEKNYNPTFDKERLKYKNYSYFSQYIKDHGKPVEILPNFTVYNSRDLYDALPKAAAH